MTTSTESSPQQPAPSSTESSHQQPAPSSWLSLMLTACALGLLIGGVFLAADYTSVVDFSSWIRVAPAVCGVIVGLITLYAIRAPTTTYLPPLESSTMDSLSGATLVKSDRSSVGADAALASADLVLYYFSAHWCPPCRQFTPMLKDFYDEVHESGVEIVFISSDRSPEDMLSYMKESHGDWLACQHNSQVANQLKQKYGVSGIPMLVVCKKDGTVVTKDGRTHVMNKSPKQAVGEWMK